MVKRSKKNIKGISTALTYLAEITALVALASTLISVVLNSILFYQWGLNFTAVATASDVFMSGLSISASLFAPALIISVCFVIIGVSDVLICKFFKNWKIRAGLWVGHVTIISAFLGFLWIEYCKEFREQALVFSPFAVGFASSYLTLIYRSISMAHVKYVIILIISVLLMFVVYIQLRQRYFVSGVIHEAMYAIGNTKYCQYSRVLWAGEYSVVVYCRTGDDRGYAVLRRQNLDFADRKTTLSILIHDREDTTK